MENKIPKMLLKYFFLKINKEASYANVLWGLLSMSVTFTTLP